VCTILQHTDLQHAATRRNILQQSAEAVNSALDPQRHAGVQHTATHCNTLTYITLQHTATHCNTLQHTDLHHTATHCNTLQRTLQQSAEAVNSALDPQRHKGVDALNAKVGRLLQQLRCETERAHVCERVREVE